MKRKISSFQPLKCLLLAGLLAASMLAFNAMADDNHWAPVDTLTDGSGNQYAYFNDPNNWSLAAVPANGDGNRVIINGTLGTPGDYVFCVVTNNMSDLYQLIMGYDGTVGGGNLIITNGAHVSFGVASGQWTGVGFPNGPSSLYIGPGCSFTCGSHLWVGQGTNNGNPAQGTVTIDGVPCSHLFFKQPPDIELELWVEKEKPDQALPKRLIVTYRSLPDQPNFIAEFSDWKLNAQPTDAEFVFTPPEGAKKVEPKPAQ